MVFSLAACSINITTERLEDEEKEPRVILDDVDNKKEQEEPVQNEQSEENFVEQEEIDPLDIPSLGDGDNEAFILDLEKFNEYRESQGWEPLEMRDLTPENVLFLIDPDLYQEWAESDGEMEFPSDLVDSYLDELDMIKVDVEEAKPNEPEEVDGEIERDSTSEDSFDLDAMEEALKDIEVDGMTPSLEGYLHVGGRPYVLRNDQDEIKIMFAYYPLGTCFETEKGFLNFFNDVPVFEDLFVNRDYEVMPNSGAIKNVDGKILYFVDIEVDEENHPFAFWGFNNRLYIVEGNNLDLREDIERVFIESEFEEPDEELTNIYEIAD